MQLASMLLLKSCQKLGQQQLSAHAICKSIAQFCVISCIQKILLKSCRCDLIFFQNCSGSPSPSFRPSFTEHQKFILNFVTSKIYVFYVLFFKVYKQNWICQICDKILPKTGYFLGQKPKDLHVIRVAHQQMSVKTPSHWWYLGILRHPVVNANPTVVLQKSSLSPTLSSCSNCVQIRNYFLGFPK